MWSRRARRAYYESILYYRLRTIEVEISRLEDSRCKITLEVSFINLELKTNMTKEHAQTRDR